VDVTDPDRQVEFLHAGRQLRAAIDEAFPRAYWDAVDFGERSCESLAAWALDRFPGARRCTVWEDLENAGGAER
jgi:hypothetical protein